MTTTIHKYINITTTGLVVSIFLFGGLLASSNTSADDTIDKVSISVPVSCTLSGAGMNSHNDNIPNGTYKADIGTTTLKAFCNDTYGFAIYANGYTNNTLGNNKLIGGGTAGEIITGTATTAGSTDVSNWAMKLQTSSSATYAMTLDNSYGAYSNVPSSYTKVAHRDSNTDIGSSAEGAELTTTYATYMSKTQAADTYSGKVIYTLVHPSNEEPLQPQPAGPGRVAYHPDNSTVVGQMGDQTTLDAESTTTITNGSKVTLWAPNFKRDGYGFAGWNTEYDYSGTNYGPNQTIVAPDDVEDNGLSLYAIWVKSQGVIQNWDGCNSLAQGSVTALTDERDGNTYAIAKLADNKCWLIENLRLDNTSELSASNTHNPSLPLNNSDGSSSNKLSAPVSPNTTAWCTVGSSACNDISMLATDNTTLFTNNMSSNYDPMGNVYSFGNYYNWYSATAGHGKYEDTSYSGYVAPGDICPSGWHLTTGFNTSSEFSILDIALGGTGGTYRTGDVVAKEQSAKWRSYPNNYIYSGYINRTFRTRGTGGRYWSPYPSAPGYAFGLVITDSVIQPGTYHDSNKYYGEAVRCISDV